MSYVLKKKLFYNSKLISKYILVGFISTAIGYGIIFALMYMSISPEVSNVIGYAIGITVSYVLNKVYTFKSNAHPRKEFPKFVASLLVSYVLNLLTLIICVRMLHINAYISQIISGAVYILSGFFLRKILLLRIRKEK